MLEIKHSPQRFAQNHYTIKGAEIEEIVAYCLLKIREQSKAFYSKDLRTNLLESGKSVSISQPEFEKKGKGNFFKNSKNNFKKNLVEEESKVDPQILEEGESKFEVIQSINIFLI